MASLRGLRVVVTRAVHQAEELAAPLRELGAEVLLLPTIAIAPPEDPGPLEQAAAACDRYDWIVFTSANAVEAFAAAIPPELAFKARIATIGEATRSAVERRGWKVTLTPEKYVAESLVTAFAEHDLHDHRVLIPSAAVTRDVIPAELRKLGAVVQTVEAYRNVVPPGASAQVEEILREPFPDWVLFASSSAVTNLVELAGVERVNRMRVATIGPVTTATAHQLGVAVTVEAVPHDAAGLVAALAGVSAAQ